MALQERLKKINKLNIALRCSYKHNLIGFEYNNPNEKDILNIEIVHPDKDLSGRFIERLEQFIEEQLDEYKIPFQWISTGFGSSSKSDNEESVDICIKILEG